VTPADNKTLDIKSYLVLVDRTAKFAGPGSMTKIKIKIKRFNKDIVSILTNILNP